LGYVRDPGPRKAPRPVVGPTTKPKKKTTTITKHNNQPTQHTPPPTNQQKKNQFRCEQRHTMLDFSGQGISFRHSEGEFENPPQSSCGQCAGMWWRLGTRIGGRTQRAQKIFRLDPSLTRGGPVDPNVTPAMRLQACPPSVFLGGNKEPLFVRDRPPPKGLRLPNQP